MSYKINPNSKIMLYQLDRNHFEIACESYKAALDYEKKMKTMSRIEREHTTNQSEYELQRTKSVIKSIVFSAFTLEAFINDYLIERSSASYFDNHLDRLTILSKWVIGTKLFNKNGIDPSKHAYEKFRRLIKLRNDLAHFKRFALDFEKLVNGEQQKFEDIYNVETAKDALECVKVLVDELIALDSSLKSNPFEDLYSNAVA